MMSLIGTDVVVVPVVGLFSLLNALFCLTAFVKAIRQPRLSYASKFRLTGSEAEEKTR